MNHDGYGMELNLVNKHLADLNPISFGWEDCRPGHAFGPAVRRYTLIHFVLEGKGRFYARGEEYIVREGEAFLIRPDEVTTYCADQQRPWEYLWIGFTGKLSARFHTLPAVFRIERHLMTSMMDVKNHPGMQEEFLAGKLFLLLASLSVDARSIDRVEVVKNYLEQNYMNSIRLETLADSMGLNRRYLSRLFKQSVGVTMQQYLTSQRMTEAGRLLGQGYPVAEVGHMVGYEDAFNFSKAFRQFYGMCPRDWRANSSQDP